MRKYVLTHEGWTDSTAPADDNHVSECEVEEYLTTLESQLAAKVEECEGLSKRVDWLLSRCNGWELSTVHNTYTGFFISRRRSGGWCGGEERWDDERIAWAPADESFASAIDRAIAGEDPDAEILADMKRKKQALLATLTTPEKP